MTKLKLEPRPQSLAQHVAKCDFCSGNHENGHYFISKTQRERGGGELYE